MKRHLKKWYLTFFPLAYHIFPLVLKCHCKVKPNTSGGYCNHIANNMHYNSVHWGIDWVLIRWHHFCQVRISVHYKSYHADQKLLEKVSNFSKLSFINMSLHTWIKKVHTSHHFTLFIMDSAKPAIQSLHSIILVNKAQWIYFWKLFIFTQPWFCSKTLFDG